MIRELRTTTATLQPLTLQTQLQHKTNIYACVILRIKALDYAFVMALYTISSYKQRKMRHNRLLSESSYILRIDY